MKPIKDRQDPRGVRGISVVQAFDHPERDWLAGQPECALLNHHGILHAGLMSAQAPFEVVRDDQSGTFMLACFSGEGRVFAEGGWVRIKAGQACLLPPFIANSLKCTEGESWGFCWVRYVESRESMPIVSACSPIRGDYEAGPLRNAIQGLVTELSGHSVPSIQHHWVELIHQYVLRFARPHREDERLFKLWRAVEEDLSSDWSLTALADCACVSEEHLRRLCKRALGRSPVSQLSYLRMQKASELLSATDLKIEAVASAVGYASGAHFSNVFSKYIGMRPSEFRGVR